MQPDTPILLCPELGTQQAFHFQALITGSNMTRQIFDSISALNALFSINFCFLIGDKLLSTSLPPVIIPAEYSLTEAGLTSLEVTLSGFQGSAKKMKTL